MCRRFDSAPRHHSPAASPSVSRNGPFPAPRYAGPGSRPPPRGAAGRARPRRSAVVSCPGRARQRPRRRHSPVPAGRPYRRPRCPGPLPAESPPNRRRISAASPPAEVRRGAPAEGVAAPDSTVVRSAPRPGRTAPSPTAFVGSPADLPASRRQGPLPAGSSLDLRRIRGLVAGRGGARRRGAGLAAPDSAVVRSAPAVSNRGFRDGVRRFLPVRAASFRRPGPRPPAISLRAGDPGRRYREGEPAPLVAVVVVWPSWVR